MAVLPALWARLLRLCRGPLAPHRVHVVFVDDGSTDGSAAWLTQLAQTHPCITLVHLAGAFGHQQALCAGLDYAPGDVLVTLDADLQDPPECIASMLELWQAGADVVFGVRQSRAGEGVVKRVCASVYYRVLGMLCPHPIPKDCGDFRLMDRRAVTAVRRLPRQYPYLRGMVACVPCVHRALPYRRAARWAGTTRYAWPKMLKLAWAGCVSFVQPARLSAGLVLACSTALAGAALCGVRLKPMWQLAALTLCAGQGCGLHILQRRYRVLTGEQPCYRIARIVGAARDTTSSGANSDVTNTNDAARVRSQNG